MNRTMAIPVTTEQIATEGFRLIRLAMSAIERWLARLMAHPLFLDVNARYADALHYPALDALLVRILWLHGVVFMLLLLLVAYAQLPALFPSPLGWRVLSPIESIIAMVLAFIALAAPLYVKRKSSNHYVWRITLSLGLTLYSFLFVFTSGGAIEMHFHFFLAMALMAVYADWRLGWLMFLVITVHHLLLDAFAPGWVYFYDRNDLAAPLQIALLIIMAFFTTVLCRSRREAIVALVEEKERNDRFLAIASHELKTPLTSMKGYAEVLERRLRRVGQSDLADYVERLDDQMNKLTGLVRDLLDLSRIQAGQVTLKRERVSLNGVIERAIEEVQGMTRQHRIVVEGWANSPVIGDDVRLCQVLANLLSNAIKYSPTSDKVLVRVVEGRDKVVVSVQDYGIGIPASDLAYVFQPYFRSQDARRIDVPGGLGMGLYIASEIVQRHGGKIWVDSVEGQGSTFSFMLPVYHKYRRWDDQEVRYA